MTTVLKIDRRNTIEAIAIILAHATATTTELYLSNIIPSPNTKGDDDLLDAITSLPHLKHLNWYNCLTKSKDVFKKLASSPIAHLTLSLTTVEHLTSSIPYLLESMHLTSLNFLTVRLESVHVQMIADQLRHNTFRLEQLFLRTTNLTRFDFVYLAIALETNNTLEYLQVADQPRGAIKYTQCIILLLKNTTLVSVHIIDSYSRLESKGSTFISLLYAYCLHPRIEQFKYGEYGVNSLGSPNARLLRKHNNLMKSTPFTKLLILSDK